MDHRYGDSTRIESVLGQVADNRCVHWVSDGDWDMHDLLIGLLMITGPATVHLSSYAFSEHAARIIVDLKARGMIRELYCLIDSRIDRRSNNALSLLENCATRCKMLSTHAKVTVLSSDKSDMAVVGSANYTTNRRYEAGVIIVNPEVVGYHKKWMMNELCKP